MTRAGLRCRTRAPRYQLSARLAVLPPRRRGFLWGARLAARLREPARPLSCRGCGEKLGGCRPAERINRVVAKHRVMGSEPADWMSDQPESMDAVGRRHELVARTFERFRTPLLRYLTDLLSWRDEAEDLVQETYLRLMQVENIDLGRVRALIFKVATNLA